MIFLAPAALTLLSLLAIPVIVHLFKPRKTSPQPFSSLRWLRESQQRLSRRIQWHQWLLFLVRAGLVTFLVLALARPYFGGEGHASVDRFVVVDVGRLMGGKHASGTMPIERARRLAEKILATAGPGDRTAVLTNGSSPRIVVPPTSDAGSHVGRLESLRATEADPEVGPALGLIGTLAGADRPVEIVFLTTSHRAGWSDSSIRTFAADPVKTKVTVIDVGEPIASNAWIASARLLAGADGTVVRVDVGFSGEAKEERTLRLKTGEREENTALTLFPGKIARAHFRLPHDAKTLTLELEPSDTLADDDRYYLTTEATSALRVLVAEPEGSGPYLSTALAALSNANPGTLRITARTVVTGEDLDDADVVLLSGQVEFAGEELERRLRDGLGVIVFAGPLEGTKAPAWARFVEPRKLEPADRRGSPSLLHEIRSTHPVFASLWDPRLSDLPNVAFRRFLSFPNVYERDVVARFDDGTPALIDLAVGAGRLLFWNTSADDAWSELPRARGFVPLVDRMLAYLASPAIGRVGEPAQLPLPAGAKDARLIGPDGTEVPGRIETRGARAFFLAESLPTAGIYQLKSGDRDRLIAVNVSREASAPAVIDAETLRTWWAPTAVELETADAAETRMTVGGSWPIAPIFIAIAGLLLLIETLYVTLLCPRRNPTVAAGIVPRRGILRPLRTETP